MMINIFISFLFLTSNVTAFDLWNGLDTNMSKEQIIARARDILNVTRPSIESSGENIRIFTGDLASLTPIIDLIILGQCQM